jgi:hypothetical protein
MDGWMDDRFAFLLSPTLHFSTLLFSTSLSFPNRLGFALAVIALTPESRLLPVN